METPQNGFDEFWQHVPRKVAKGAAINAYRRALRIASAGTILAGIKRYAAERAGEDPQYTKHPSTWLNGQCWDDEPMERGNHANGKRTNVQAASDLVDRLRALDEPDGSDLRSGEGSPAFRVVSSR